MNKSSGHAIPIILLALSAAFIHRVACSFSEKHSVLGSEGRAALLDFPLLHLSQSPLFALLFYLISECESIQRLGKEYFISYIATCTILHSLILISIPPRDE